MLAFEVILYSMPCWLSTRYRSKKLKPWKKCIRTIFVILLEQERMQQQGLTIVNIAPYSPELNIIEILWRKIKYEWMPFSAYESFHNMKESLFKILANIGKYYTVNFAWK